MQKIFLVDVIFIDCKIEPKQQALSMYWILSRRFVEFPVVSSFTSCDELGTASTDIL